MSSDKLVYMANQIAINFRSMAEAAAVAAVADHIRSFWSPRMRIDLQAMIESGGSGLDPVVHKAFDLLKARQKS